MWVREGEWNTHLYIHKFWHGIRIGIYLYIYFASRTQHHFLSMDKPTTLPPFHRALAFPLSFPLPFAHIHHQVYINLYVYTNIHTYIYTYSHAFVSILPSRMRSLDRRWDSLSHVFYCIVTLSCELTWYRLFETTILLHHRHFHDISMFYMNTTKYFIISIEFYQFCMLILIIFLIIVASLFFFFDYCF